MPVLGWFPRGLLFTRRLHSTERKRNANPGELDRGGSDPSYGKTPVFRNRLKSPRDVLLKTDSFALHFFARPRIENDAA